MPQFLIERQIPGAGNLSGAELQSISKKSCGVLHEMNSSGKDVQWVHSYVTGDKIYCVYNAPNEQAVREHATKGGFPANAVMEVARTISPITAERSD
jgi:Nickel responsive protein SCO4226-like